MPKHYGKTKSVKSSMKMKKRKKKKK